MATRAYGVSMLASLLLIASPTAPWVHKLFTDDRGLADVMARNRLPEFLAGVEDFESATVVSDRAKGQSRGFGFVEMATAEATNAAMSNVNRQVLDGCRLRIEHANALGERRTDVPGITAGRALVKTAEEGVCR